jgi:hypothetical protein
MQLPSTFMYLSIISSHIFIEVSDSDVLKFLCHLMHTIYRHTV